MLANSLGGDYGHSEYASIGQYYINGTVPPQIDITDPPVAPDTVTVALVGDNSIELGWTDPPSPPEADEAGYHVYHSIDGGAFGKVASLPRDGEFYADNNLGNGTYSYYLEVYNSTGTDYTAETDPVTINEPIVAVATSESTALGVVSSGSYLETQAEAGAETLSEEHSGRRPSHRQSYLEHTGVVTGVTPAAMVQLDVTASAPDNGEGDNFLFTYSVNGGSWEPLGTLLAGTGSMTFTVALPADTEGSVSVRVEDTDRTTGARNTDMVSVSLIRVTSSGDVAEQPPAVSIIAPADGTSVESGTEVFFTGEAYDFEDGDRSAEISWSSDIQGSLGSGASASVFLNDGTHAIAAAVSDSAGLTATDTITVTVSNEPTAQTMSVADLEGLAEARGKGGNWAARVTILVRDDLGAVVSGATVGGDWSGAATGSASCVTDSAGLCAVEQTLKRNDSLVSFTITGIAGTLGYHPDGNSDADGDSDGNTMDVSAP